MPRRPQSDAVARLRRVDTADHPYPKSDFARFCSEGGVDWAGVLDYVRDRCGFVEDKQLSKHLDIPSSTLSAVRKGNAELSMLAKFRLLDRFGYHLIADAAELLEGDELAAKRRRAARRERGTATGGASRGKND